MAHTTVMSQARRRLLLLLLTLLAAWASAELVQPLGHSSHGRTAISPLREYDNCQYLNNFDGQVMRLHWSIDRKNHVLKAAMEATADGWVGVGFNDHGNMHNDYKGSDMIIGWRSPSGPCQNGCLQDFFAWKYQAPTRDDLVDTNSTEMIDLGLQNGHGSVDARLVHAQNENGVTIIEFDRPLRTGDVFDYQLDPSKAVYVIFAANLYMDPPYAAGTRLAKHHFAGAAQLTLGHTHLHCSSHVSSQTRSYNSPDGRFQLRWKITSDNKHIQFDMMGKTTGWVAVGFDDGSRPDMPGSDMVVGWVSDGTNSIYDRWATARMMPDQDVDLGGVDNVELQFAKETADATQLIFTRPLVTNDKFDVQLEDKMVWLLWAIGEQDGDPFGGFEQHSHKGSVKVNLFTGSVDNTFDVLRRLHGALMIAAFCICFTVSAFVARFTEKKVGRFAIGCGRRWIHWHVALNALGVIFIIVAVAFIIYVAGLDDLFMHTHGILGFVTLLLALFAQSFLGYVAHKLSQLRAKRGARPSVVKRRFVKDAESPSGSTISLHGEKPQVNSPSNASDADGAPLVGDATAGVDVESALSPTAGGAAATHAVGHHDDEATTDNPHRPIRSAGPDSSEDDGSSSSSSGGGLTACLLGTSAFHHLHRHLGRAILVLSFVTIGLGMKLYSLVPGYYFTMFYVFIVLMSAAFMAKLVMIYFSKAASSRVDETTGKRTDPTCKRFAETLLCLAAVAAGALVVGLIIDPRAKQSHGAPLMHAAGISCTDCDVWEHTFVNHTLDPVPTAYVCRNWWLPADKDYHMVRFEPIVKDPSIVHHMTLFAWPDGLNEQDEHWDCRMTPEYAIIVYFWGMGMDPFEYPAEAGFRVSPNGVKRFALQVHYENPDLAVGLKDSSGMRVYVTDQLRPYDGSSLRIGVPLPKISIPPGQDDYLIVDGVCSATSTASFALPAGMDHLTILAAGFHMHELGKRAISKQYRNDELVALLGEEPDYKFENQRMFTQTGTILRGDTLVTQCWYDSRTRVNATPGGFGTDEEMCWNTLMYYPKLTDGRGFCLT